MRTTYIILAALMLTAISGFPASARSIRIPANSVDIAGKRPVILGLRGSYKMECKSHWHQVEFDFPLQKNISLAAKDLMLLNAGGPVYNNQKWTAGTSKLQPLANSMLKMLDFQPKPADRKTWDAWVGADVRKDDHRPFLDLTNHFLNQARVGNKIVYNMRLAGTMVVTRHVRYADRKGPKTRSETWTLQLTGDYQVDATTREVRKMVLKLKGTVSGKYYDSAEQFEDFTGTVEATFSTDALMPVEGTVKEKLDALIKELAADKPQVRVDALKKVRALSPLELQSLIGMLKKSDDPELQFQAVALAER
jgi:hypothetical protein